MTLTQTDETTLGQLIEDRRIQLGLTKAAAARAAGLSRSSWHEIEADQRQQLQPETFAAIDRALEWAPGTLRSQTDKRRVLVIDTKAERETRPAQGRFGPGGETARLVSIQLQLEELRRILLELSDDLNRLYSGITRVTEELDDARHDITRVTEELDDARHDINYVKATADEVRTLVAVAV